MPLHEPHQALELLGRMNVLSQMINLGEEKGFRGSFPGFVSFGSAFISQEFLYYDDAASRLGTMLSCLLHHVKYNKRLLHEKVLVEEALIYYQL